MAAYHVVYISRRIILKAIDHEAYSNVDWWIIVIRPILTNFITVPPILILVLIVTQVMIRRKVKKIYLLITHFLLFILYSLLITFLAFLYEYLVSGTNYFEQGLITLTLFGSNLNFLGYVGFVTIMYSYYYVQKVSRMETQELKLSQQLQNAKLQALKSQLNPHFLFNTLHGISSLVKNNPNKAQNMIGSLGDLLREVLMVKDSDMIPVRKEMVILNKYIDIMHMRFSDHLSIEINIDADVQEARIPSMLLQPIMENSFEHGYSYNHTSLKIVISIRKEHEKLIISIRNNGALLSKTDVVEGTGLQNIRERLETMFHDNFEFSVSNLENKKGVISIVKIPFQ